jgi:two-component system, LytTR family, response regulator
MIRTIIIDDEPKSRDTLSALLTGYCKGVVVEATAANVTEAVSYVRQVKPELIFLDISMPDGNGFDLLNQIQGFHLEVVFTTGYSEYALPAIKASAVDYLLKPLDIYELQQAVIKAEARIHQRLNFYNVKAMHMAPPKQPKVKPDTIAVPVHDGLQFVAVNNILRVAASGSYTLIYCSGNICITSTRSLREYEDMLPACQFFRVHNSHIVNLSYIMYYHRGDGGYVTMCDGSVVFISKRKKKDFLDLFQA